MLGPLVLNGVGRQVNCTDIVTIHDGGSTKRAMELMKELAQPARLRNSIGDSAILGLSTGSRDSSLTLRRPGNQIVTQEHTVARGRTTGVGATSPPAAAHPLLPRRLTCGTVVLAISVPKLCPSLLAPRLSPVINPNMIIYAILGN